MNCQYCNKTITNKGSLISHEQVCQDNPKRVKRKRAKDAGSFKQGNTPWNKGKRVGPADTWREKYPNEKIFVIESTYNRNSLKRRILSDNLIEYKCNCCGLGPEWQDKPMPLILDHINGVNNDNRIENLRFVCSNCDSQLPTYKSRNINYGEYSA